MKIKFLALIFLPFILLSCDDNSQNDLEKKNLIGNVKSVKEFSFLAIEKFGEISKGERGRENYWDKNTHISFNEGGDEIEISEYFYDGTFFIITVFSYNDKGNLIEKKSHLKDKEFHIEESYKYGIDGFLIQTNLYSNDGSQSGKLVYKNDKNGNVIEMNQLASDTSFSNLNLKFVYSYNKDGNKTEFKGYYADGREYINAAYVYLNGRKTESIFYRNESLESKTKLQYNKNQVLVKESINRYNTENIIVSNRTLIYDENENPLEIIDTKGDNQQPNIITYRYLFDEAGNWVERIEFQNNIPKYIIDRKIDYY